MEQTQTQIKDPTKEPQNLPEANKSLFSKITDKIPVPLKDVTSKFYENKLIFWLVTGLLGFFLLMVVLAVVLSGSRKEQEKATPLPTPEIQILPTSAPDDVITTVQKTLIELKEKILSYDVKQSRLTPPAVNYEINF